MGETAPLLFTALFSDYWFARPENTWPRGAREGAMP